MIKKIITILLLSLLLAGGVFAEGEKEKLMEIQSAISDAQSTINSLNNEEGDVTEAINYQEQKLEQALGELPGAKEAYDQSEESEGDISSKGFQINVSNVSPGGTTFINGDAEQTTNFLLGTIIEKLMVALGSLSLLIMTIGGGYMILFHGQDELLSKGKSIFMSGIVALVVALSSYYLIAFIRYILYS